MSNVIQHLYKFSSLRGGLLYAWFPSMYTRVDIVLCGMQSEEALMLVVGAIHEMLYCLEKVANYYDAESELAYLNRTAAMGPQPVSKELYDMLTFCVDCYARTDGCFDITIHSANYMPNSIRNIQLSPQEQTLYFSQLGTTINLSAFLKGYALEKIRKLLQHYEVNNALVNMGNSSILALGNHPLANGWIIDFEQAATSRRSGQLKLLLRDECLTTSGNNSFERKHIINPQTGKLVEGKREVAVVTANGITGEVLSTSLFVAETCQRKFLETEFCPHLIIDL